jgi:hypothetical protein
LTSCFPGMLLLLLLLLLLLGRQSCSGSRQHDSTVYFVTLNELSRRSPHLLASLANAPPLLHSFHAGYSEQKYQHQTAVRAFDGCYLVLCELQAGWA